MFSEKKNSLKICHITSVHPPLDVRIFHKECSSLQANGYEVYLLHSMELNTIENGVHIKGLNFKNLNRYQRFKKVVDDLAVEALKLKADVYHLHDPELLRISLQLKLNGAKVIYDAHEDLPRDILSKKWIPFIIRKPVSIIAERMENYYAKRIDGVISATAHIANRYLKINSNTVDVNNYPLLNELNSIQPLKGNNEICYVGGISRTRGIYELIDAIDNLDVTLHLAGTFDDEQTQKEIMAKPGWKKVIYHGFVGRKEVWDILARSSIGIVTLYPLLNYLDALPIKMFEYMYAGIPVIASDFPVWSKILEENNCGITVDPKNPKEIADGISNLLINNTRMKEMGINGKSAVEKKYNWSFEENKLIIFYHKILNK